MSSTCRTENSTIASFAGATPRTPTVALQIERRAFPFRRGKAPVLWLRLDQGPRSITGFGAVKRRFQNPASGPHCVLRDFHPSLWCRCQMRGPVKIGQRTRNRRDAAGQTGERRMKRAIDLTGLDRSVSVGLRCVCRARFGSGGHVGFINVGHCVSRTWQTSTGLGKSGVSAFGRAVVVCTENSLLVQG
jgi:hypothetical protein